MNDDINPYAPPSVAASQESRPKNAIVVGMSGPWRDRDYMVIRPGVEFPEVCLVSGKPAETVSVRTFGSGAFSDGDVYAFPLAREAIATIQRSRLTAGGLLIASSIFTLAWLAPIGIVGAGFSLYFFLTADPLRVHFHRGDTHWVHNVHPSVLEMLPPWTGASPLDS